MATTKQPTATNYSSTAVAQHPQSQHGLKRRADDGLEGEQRLSKRFNLLNLEQNGKLWIAAPGQQHHEQPPADHVPALSDNSAPAGATASLTSPPPPSAQDDYMQIEDTPNRIYIHNLDAELADSSSSSSITEPDDEEHLIFLPEISRHLAKVPAHLLRDPAAAPQQPSNALVLYQVPSSLSVPQERDSVRKAILDARARAREMAGMRQLEEQIPPSLAREVTAPAGKDEPGLKHDWKRSDERGGSYVDEGVAGAEGTMEDDDDGDAMEIE